MEPFYLFLWLLRILFLAAIYLVLWVIVRALLRDLRSAARDPAGSLGRLVVVSTGGGEPTVGTVYPLDAVTTIGRDLGCSIVIDDPFASAQHAALTYRGRAWYLEDLGSTNGTLLNGQPVGAPAPLGFGDIVGVGEVAFRLERPRR
ncbi:MAG: domain containing protein [Chloroflexi bacterium]|nr:domain containing protein [Chloroflexota bacterium]